MPGLVVHSCMQCMSLRSHVQRAEVLMMSFQVLRLFTHKKA